MFSSVHQILLFLLKKNKRDDVELWISSSRPNFLFSHNTWWGPALMQLKGWEVAVICISHVRPFGFLSTIFMSVWEEAVSDVHFSFPLHRWHVVIGFRLWVLNPGPAPAAMHRQHQAAVEITDLSLRSPSSLVQWLILETDQIAVCQRHLA